MKNITITTEKWIGGFAATNPKASKSKFDSLLQINTDDRSIRTAILIQRTKTIAIYDDYSYFISPVNGSEVFDDYEKLYETIQRSKFNNNLNNSLSTAINKQTNQPTIDLFKYNLEENPELVEINHSNDVNNSVRDFKKLTNIVNSQPSGLNVDDGKIKVLYVIVEDKNKKKTGRFIVKGYL